MGEGDKLSKVESRISLTQQIFGGASWVLTYFGLWPYLLALGITVFAALYSALGWVGQYGWAGWFLLALASIVVVSFIAIFAFTALTKYEAFKRAKQAPGAAAQTELGSVFEAATGVGELKAQLDIFEEDTRSALNLIQIKISSYNKTVTKINDSYSSLRLLRCADKANKNLISARNIFDKILDGEWDSWEKWPATKEAIETHLRTYSHAMRNFIRPDEEIFRVNPIHYSPRWLGDRNINFPDDQTKHEFLTLFAYLYNARSTHTELVSRFNSRIIPDSAIS